ncbi:MAG: non-homologous end-joining DNA ligase [Actinomycetota bacterium]|nr:non-homologous end-joining DNA ligase [Actinomycetota bacterium]
MPANFEPKITNPDRVLWPDDAITKQQLIDYYKSVSNLLIPELKQRLLTLKRAPSGIEGEIFFQKNAPSYTPDWIATRTVEAPSAKREIRYLVCNNARTLVWVANQSGVELHHCLDRISRWDRPDMIVFDLDPPEGRFDLAVNGAFVVRSVLKDLGANAQVKTTGGKGLHVCLRIRRLYDYQRTHSFAVKIGELATQKEPGLFTMEFSKADRGGRVYFDAHRNGPGATIASVFSPRARPGAPVSFPIAWSDLDKVAAEEFTMTSVIGRLDSQAVKDWVTAKPQTLGTSI